jgi:hypothetical protein
MERTKLAPVARGVVSGALLAVPLWVIIAGVIVHVV